MPSEQAVASVLPFGENANEITYFFCPREGGISFQVVASQNLIVLSAPQVYRLVVQTPERLSLRTLMALCDALDCTMADLIEPVEERVAAKRRKAVGETATADPVMPRPKRARIVH